jgi:hypothetical protein
MHLIRLSFLQIHFVNYLGVFLFDNLAFGFHGYGYFSFFHTKRVALYYKPFNARSNLASSLDSLRIS